MARLANATSARSTARLLPVLAAASLLVIPLHAALNAQDSEDSALPPALTAEATAETMLDEIAGEDIGIGEASYYGKKFAGNRTASGERFNPQDLTAAHRTLPFGSRVQVTSVRTGKSVVVRINDRGPFHGGRIIDLSKAAAQEIGLVTRGHGQVQLSLLTE